jgi:hypothetical protein
MFARYAAEPSLHWCAGESYFHLYNFVMRIVGSIAIESQKESCVSYRCRSAEHADVFSDSFKECHGMLCF